VGIDIHKIPFPKRMLVSKNWFDRPSMDLNNARRITNVSCIMEWIPDPSKLKLKNDDAIPLTDRQKGLLQTAFTMFDLENRGRLAEREFTQFLDILDVRTETPGASAADIMKLLGIDDPKSGVDFETLCFMMENQIHARFDTGRQYIAISLFEAESLRGLLHLTQAQGLPDANNAQVALRTILGTGSIIDATTNYPTASEYQEVCTDQCYRFFDSDAQFHYRHLNMLLKSFSQVKLTDRVHCFEDARSCKRRNQTPIGGTSLGRFFTIQDGYQMLQYRAIVASVGSRISARGLFLLDAFRGFDVDNDGILNCSELYSGLRFLGLNFKPELVYDVIRSVDLDGNGGISFFEFKQTFMLGQGGSYDVDSRVSKKFETFTVKQYSIPELADMAKEEQKAEKKATSSQLSKLSYHVERVTEFKSVWKSRGLGTRMKLALYNPVTSFKWMERAFNAHKLILCLGGYANNDYRHPRSTTNCCTLQIKDEDASFGAKSAVTKAGKAKHFPHPKRYHQVWSTNRKGQPFFAWSAIPPSKEYVSLGMLFTTTDAPPPLEAICCVPVRAIKKSTFTPQLLWTDKGSTGRPGSCWIVNELKLAHIFVGHDPPTGPFFDFVSSDFTLKE
jgi:Ca2+-binding EF-hand superfamily protein